MRSSTLPDAVQSLIKSSVGDIRQEDTKNMVERVLLSEAQTHLQSQ